MYLFMHNYANLCKFTSTLKTTGYTRATLTSIKSQPNTLGRSSLLLLHNVFTAQGMPIGNNGHGNRDGVPRPACRFRDGGTLSPSSVAAIPRLLFVSRLPNYCSLVAWILAVSLPPRSATHPVAWAYSSYSV